MSTESRCHSWITKHNWQRGYMAEILIFAAVFLAGCSSVTYKRGASPDTMMADEGLCRAGNSDPSEFRRCMRDKGWFVAGVSGGKYSLDTKNKEPHSRSASKIDVGKSVATGPQSATYVEKRAAAQSEPEAPVTTNGRSEQESRQPEEFVSEDPLALTSVASWWKFGGTASGLDLDMADCLGNLGERHRPAPGVTSVTNAMGKCLKANGWYAIGK